MSTLNVTFAGSSHNVAELEPSTTDEDVKRIAIEALNAERLADHERMLEPNTFDHYVIDRFADTGMIYLRPKVPFG